MHPAPLHITPQPGPSSHRLTDFPGSDAQQFVARMGEQGEKAARDGVGEGAAAEVHRLTDAEREAAIVRAGRAVERHMATWHREGCMAAKGDADRALRLMELLIRGRSAEQVQRMEAERGLA